MRRDELTIDERLRRIRRAIDGEFYGRRKEDPEIPLPPRSAAFSARVEHALNVGLAGHDSPVNAGALAAVNEALRPTISWQSCLRRKIGLWLKPIAFWGLDLANRWIR